MKSENTAVTVEVARKVLAVIDAGLMKGIGSPDPGKMCVESAVCYTLGLPHSDKPTCVGESVRPFIIIINEANWSTNKARAMGMRKLAIAQLGSDSIEQVAFSKIVVEQTIRQIIPLVLRMAASRSTHHGLDFEKAALRCEKEGTAAAVKNALKVADVAASSATYAAITAIADIVAAAAAAAADNDDKLLLLACKIGLDALVMLKSPGCELLFLTEEMQCNY